MTARTTDHGGPPTGPPFARRLLAPMVLGSILNPVNSSIIAVALVPIGLAFGAPASQTAWLVSGLYLATSIGQPLMGRLIDSYGPRRLYLVGAALTGLAGLVGMLAPNLATLVAARVLLGFGTCAGYPASMTLIRREADRTGVDSPAAVLTVLSIATQTVAVVGPTLGGLLIGLGDWRATFAVNVPLALACLALGARVLPRDGDRPTPAGRLDLPGVVLFAVAVTALLLFLMDVRAAPWWLLGIALGAGAGFLARELRAGDPFIDVRVLAGNTPLLLTYLRGTLTATVSYCLLYGVPQWLEQARGLTPTQTGLVLLPLFAVGMLVAALTGRRPEIRGKLVVGSLAQVVACVLLLATQPAQPIWLLLLFVVVAGVPQGLLNLALQNAVYHQADAQRLGASAGLLRTFFYLGAIIASVVGGLVFGGGVTIVALHELAAVMLAASVLLALLCLLDRGLAGVAAGRGGLSS